MGETGVHRRFAEEDSQIPFRAVEGLIVKPLPTAKGEHPMFAVRARGRKPCSLPEEEYFIFTLLDGSPTLADIEHEFRARFGSGLSRPHFQEFMEELLAAGVVERIPVEPPVAPQQPRPVRETRAAGPRPPSDQPQGDAAPPDGDAHQVNGISLLPIYLLLARLGSPVRFFVWLLVPAAAFASILSFGQAHHALVDLSAINWNSRCGVADAFAAASIVLLAPVLAQGAVAAFHGAPREAFRLRLSARFLWNGLLDRDCIDRLPRKARVWTYAAPLLARFALFVFGSLLWVSLSGTSDQVSVIGWLIAQVGLWLFLMTALPVWPAAGRRWMAAYFGASVADEDVPNDYDSGDDNSVSSELQTADQSGMLGFQIFATLITLLAMAGASLPWISRAAGMQADATAEIIFCVAVVAAMLWLWAGRSTTGPLRSEMALEGATVARTFPGTTSFARSAHLRRQWAGNGPVSLDERLYAAGSAWPSDRNVMKAAFILALLLAILFLPYPYESGGPFTVMPYDRAYLPARVSGEVTEVLAHEGEWVKPGQLVGILSDWTEVHGLALAEAELQKALADLQNLLISPKPQEVEVAKQQYEQALSRLPFAKEDYERMLALVKTNDVSVRQFQQAQSTYEQDLAAVNVTKANYDYVRVGPTQAQIDAARAEVHLATDQVAYWKDQVGRTRIRATQAGQVVTPDPQLMMGKFLKEGTPFIRIEDDRIAHVEVQVPEDDIRDIHIGSAVRAKAWGYEHSTWHGTVTLIAPDAQPDPPLNANIVRVIAEIPNPDGLLRPDMTGYAKVQTVDMPVWESFTRALMRFLLIEVWYWIP